MVVALHLLRNPTGTVTRSLFFAESLHLLKKRRAGQLSGGEWQEPKKKIALAFDILAVLHSEQQHERRSHFRV